MKHTSLVPTTLTGMDVAAARHLARRLERWPSAIDDVLQQLATAHRLCDITLDSYGALEAVAPDGGAMAAAIDRAADALESFTLSIDSPLTVAVAVAAVKNFRGSDNDPELDARLRTLRSLVEAHTSDPQEAARVMAALLGARQSSDVRFRDTTAVELARREVDRLSRLEATGAISSNDPRIDAAARALRGALDGHASGPDESLQLAHMFFADDNRSVPTLTLLASVLTGQSQRVVERAHEDGLDYRAAEMIVGFEEADRLTALLSGASFSSVARLADRRREVLLEVTGTSDPMLITSITEQLDQGVAAADAYVAAPDYWVARQLRLVYEQQRQSVVEALADATGVNEAEISARLAEREPQADRLLDAGWSPDDIEQAIVATTVAELDLADVESLARERNLTLAAAADILVRADRLALSIDELDAYDGFVRHFDVFDTARGGKADGLVSLFDIDHVITNPDEFSAKVVAAALSFMASPSLIHRLDSARDNNDVLGDERFGADHAADLKVSHDDIAQFELKQATNYWLADHLDAVDVAGQGGHAALIDGTRTKEDFQAYLDDADELGLAPAVRVALQTVIDADWYDEKFWDRHGDTIAFAAGAIAGGAVVLMTAGAGSVVVVGFWATVGASAAPVAVGATAGAAATMIGNAIEGDPLTENLFRNTALGASGGLFAVGVVGGGGASGTLRLLQTTANGATVVSNGVADPVLEHLVDEATLQRIHDDARMLSYAAGAGSVVLQGYRVGANALGQSSVGASALGQSSVGANALGQSSVGANALGQTSVGANALGQASVGAALSDEAAKVAQETAERLSGYGLDELVEDRTPPVDVESLRAPGTDYLADALGSGPYGEVNTDFISEGAGAGASPD